MDEQPAKERNKVLFEPFSFKKKDMVLQYKAQNRYRAGILDEQPAKERNKVLFDTFSFKKKY